MAVSDSYRKHGARSISYNQGAIIKAVQLVMRFLEQSGERPIAGMVVAAVLVHMQAEASGDSLDNTIELLRSFIDHLKRDREMPRA